MLKPAHYVKRDIMLNDRLCKTGDYVNQLELWKAGDYTSLICKHERLLWHILHTHVYGLDRMSSEDVEDFYQLACESAIRAYQSYKEFDDDMGCSLSTWTYSYVKTYCIRHAQALWGHELHVCAIEDLANERMEGLQGDDIMAEDIEEMSDEGAHWEEVEADIDAEVILNSLPEVAAKIVALSNTDFSQAEIARALEIPQTSVSRILAQSTRSLKDHYESEL